MADLPRGFRYHADSKSRHGFVGAVSSSSLRNEISRNSVLCDCPCRRAEAAALSVASDGAHASRPGRTSVRLLPESLVGLLLLRVRQVIGRSVP
jgi:hypothetical protein